MTPQEAMAIQVFRKPLLQRLFYVLFRWGWLVVLLLAFLLTGCSVDNSAEWRDSDEAIAVQQEEQAKSAREFAGQAVCGPGALAQWISDKDLQCVPKRGAPYQLAKGTP